MLQASRLSTDLHCNTEGRGPGSLPQREKVRAQKIILISSTFLGAFMPPKVPKVGTESEILLHFSYTYNSTLYIGFLILKL